MEYTAIASTANPIVKGMKALATKKGRSAQAAFLAEGAKIVVEALDSGLKPITAFVGADCVDSHVIALADRMDRAGARVYAVSDAVLQAAGDAVTTQPIIAAFALPSAERSALSRTGLFLALDAIQDPGNLGAMLRSADAMGVTAVLLGEGCADPYAPKSVRAAMGSTFHVPLIGCENLVQELGAMQRDGGMLVAADLSGVESMPPLCAKTVLLIGNEGNGLRPEVIAIADARYRLSMPGRSESLNAAVCAGILLYAFSREMPS